MPYEPSPILSALGRECAECLAHEPHRYGWEEMSQLARSLVDRAEAPLPELLAALVGLRVEEAVLGPDVPAVLIVAARLILVSCHLRALERTLALYHEIAHAEAPQDASHSDVWALTLCLLHPPQQVMLATALSGAYPTAQDLYERSTPAWAAVLRARYLRGAGLRIV